MSLKIGIAGSVGSGKTSLIESMTNILKDNYEIAIITNDIHTIEDANYLKHVLDIPKERIIGIETETYPHTAIRDDISINKKAVQSLDEKEKFDIIFIESGGDNLSATFSYELVDYYIYVIDVTQGSDVPRKKGAGILFSDLLLINKIDLSPYVGIDLKNMEKDVQLERLDKPYIFTSNQDETSLRKIEKWIKKLL